MSNVVIPGWLVMIILGVLTVATIHNHLFPPKTSAQREADEVNRVEWQVKNFLDNVDYLCLDGVLYYERQEPHQVWFAPYVDKTTLTFVRCTDNVAP